MKIIDKNTMQATDVGLYYQKLKEEWAGRTFFDNYFLDMIKIVRYDKCPNCYIIYPKDEVGTIYRGLTNRRFI